MRINHLRQLFHLFIGVGGYMWVTGGRYEETENANLLFSKIAIASELSGRVTTSNVTNNKQVKKGDILFQVDPEPLKIAVEQAKAAGIPCMDVEGLKSLNKDKKKVKKRRKKRGKLRAVNRSHSV